MQDQAVARSLLRFHVFCNPGWRWSCVSFAIQGGTGARWRCSGSVFVFCNPGSRFAVQRLPVENFLV